MLLMSRRQRQWMRLVRLLVACLAFVLARPAFAAPVTFDGTVLVASCVPSESEPSASTEKTSSSASRISARQTPTAHDVLPDDVHALPQLQSPRALIARKYLRHCSLLC
jgi:hypothetical protein